MLTLLIILSIAALICVLAVLVRPSWNPPILAVAVLILAIVECLEHIPLGR